jgi:D-threonate/D-erythronate kinase
VEILGAEGWSGVRYAEPGSAMGDGVTVGGGATTAEIEGWANAVDERTLAVGGAEFFAALLKSRGWARRELPVRPTPAGAMLVVCGSRPKGEIPNALHMPSSLNHWRETICAALTSKQCAIMAAPIGRWSPEEVTEELADAVAFVLERCGAQWLVIEGGETAAAIVGKLEWSRFAVDGQLEPGVVQLRVTGSIAPGLIVKPGSYPWPSGFREALGI